MVQISITFFDVVRSPIGSHGSAIASTMRATPIHGSSPWVAFPRRSKAGSRPAARACCAVTISRARRKIAVGMTLAPQLTIGAWKGTNALMVSLEPWNARMVSSTIVTTAPPISAGHGFPSRIWLTTMLPKKTPMLAMHTAV